MESTPECPRCAHVAKGLELLRERMREKDRLNAELERALEEERAHRQDLEKRVAALEQKRHPSVAPHRRPKEERTSDPKPPGPPKGHPAAFRRLPPELCIPTVTAPLCGCPHCGRPVEEVHPLQQVIVDLPPITPVYYRVVTYSGHCPNCGRVRSTHPWQVSGATGAAGIHLGPSAQAVAVDLRHSHGLTTRRVCAILHDHFHLPLSQGGLCQLLARASMRLLPEYEALVRRVRQSESVHADETSWWLLGRMAWLWVLATEEATLYHISPRRDAATLKGMLGPRYAGVLVSDCLNIYDRYEAEQKSKCMAHHLRAIAEAKAGVVESVFLTKLWRLMGAALKLQRSVEKLPKEVYERGVTSLERRLTELLEPSYSHREEERIAGRFRRRREAIFTFLHRPEVAATNNLAERQLRPAVITRKLSCGNKTEAGARTWEVLASLAATCRQRGESFVAMVAKHLTGDGETGPGMALVPAAAGHG